MSAVSLLGRRLHYDLMPLAYRPDGVAAAYYGAVNSATHEAPAARSGDAFAQVCRSYHDSTSTWTARPAVTASSYGVLSNAIRQLATIG